MNVVMNVIADKFYQLTLKVYVWYTFKMWEVEEYMDEFVRGYLRFRK